MWWCCIKIGYYRTYFAKLIRSVLSSFESHIVCCHIGVLCMSWRYTLWNLNIYAYFPGASSRFSFFCLQRFGAISLFLNVIHVILLFNIFIHFITGSPETFYTRYTLKTVPHCVQWSHFGGIQAILLLQVNLSSIKELRTWNFLFSFTHIRAYSQSTYILSLPQSLLELFK